MLLVAIAAAAGVLYWQQHQSKGSVAAAPILTSNALPATEIMIVTQQVSVVTNEFDWRQLESEDYKTYITRLRSIGCPEQTIRDIIISDLDKLMAPTLQAIYGRKKNVNYWESEEEELANN